MKIKLDVRPNVIYVRRTAWDKDAKKMKQESLCKFPKYLELPELSQDVVVAKNVTKDQQEQYNLLAKEYNEKLNQKDVNSRVRNLDYSLEAINEALDNDEAVSQLSTEQLEEMSESANSIKKKVTALKKKALRKAQKAN